MFVLPVTFPSQLVCPERGFGSEEVMKALNIEQSLW